MDSNEALHREVLELLGFELIWSTGGGIYRLRRNGGLTIGGGVSIDKAWAQAPTLDALALPLLVAMTTKETSFVLRETDGMFQAGLHHFSWGDLPPMYSTPSETLPEAIAALFIGACRNNLIDAGKVVLP